MSPAHEHEYTLPLTHPRATPERVRGKGASLARLAAAGLPVPGAFHVTTDAYRRFVAENDLQGAILAAVRGVRPAQPSTLETASQTIAARFARAPVPGEIAGWIGSSVLIGLDFGGRRPSAPSGLLGRVGLWSGMAWIAGLALAPARDRTSPNHPPR